MALTRTLGTAHFLVSTLSPEPLTPCVHCRGYAYAIATSSYVVMNYIASLSGGSFTVSYPGTVSGA